MKASRLIGFGAVLAGVVALPFAAMADHGKAGLWDITVSMKLANMPKIPPDQLAKMKAMGITIPNMSTMTVQHCMTAAEVAADKPPQMQRSNKDCAMQDIKMYGGHYTADMVCKGPDMNGSGHFDVGYDAGGTHYMGKMTFVGTTHGHVADMTNTFEGHWIKADCGSVGH